MEDRLEAILRHAGKWHPKEGTFVSIDTKVKKVADIAREKKSPAHRCFSPELTDGILDWKGKRNRLIHALLGNSGDKAAELLEKTASKQEKAIANAKKAGTISDSEAASGLRAAKIMQRMQKQILEKRPENGSAAFTLIKEEFDAENKELKKLAQLARQRLENMFTFCEKVFPDGQELLILVTELTLRPYAARFIGKYGCDGYFRNNKNLLFYERKTEILKQIEDLGLE